MKRNLALIAVLLAGLGASHSATVPIYINNSPTFSATNIDAVAWLNRAYFNVFTPTGIPFESRNTRFFTNAPSSSAGLYPAGTMVLDPGLRFFYNTNGQRLWMDTWVNNGNIFTDHQSFFSSGSFQGSSFIVLDSLASILQVAATNIISTGPLFSGAQGLIRLEGKNINLTRNALRTGGSVEGSIFSGFSSVGSSNYLNDVGVRDIYWGGGTGNAVDPARARSTRTDGLGNPTLSLPFPSSSTHEVIQSFGGFGTTLGVRNTTVPSGSLFLGTNIFGGNGVGGYTAAVHTASLTTTSRIVQVVYYPTNGTDTNFTTDVRFYDSSGGFGSGGEPAFVAVGFHSTDFDIATQEQSTDSIYLVDGLAATTNLFFARNNAGTTRRPSTYALTRAVPSEYFSGVPGNSNYSASLFSSTNFTLTTVTNRYAGYAAAVDLLSSSAFGSIPYDITNVPGRVEILGDVVNLDQTRIRAESAVIIKAKNLTSNRLAQVDAPLINFDVRSTEPSLVISNLAPATVRRLSGAISAWSATWENFELVQSGTNISTNSVTFHVLIVDSLLQSQVPVTVNEFAARGTNVVIEDALSVGRSFVVEGDSVHFTKGLTLPFGVELSSSTLLNVRNFTNDGVINVAGAEYFGTDRVLSYSNYVNHGSNVAAAHDIRTRNFENTGYIQANGGALTVDAVNASLVGPPLLVSNSFITNVSFFPGFGFFTNIFLVSETSQQGPQLDGASGVQIYARDLTTSNSIINGGTLLLSITNQLVDSGVDAMNLWNVTGGFNFARKPTTSDLSGTELRSTAARFAQVDHFSSATDLGNSPVGYTNNLALRKLILDGGESSFFRFYGNGTSNAIYVDYLELVNATTNFNSSFSIAPNLTIYFANASVPPSKLDGAAGGRFRWVSSYAGPLSSTNIVYPSGSNYTFNIALVQNKDLDSDGDGIVNADDETPIYVAESAILTLSLAAEPDMRALLSWNALAYSSNYLEFKTSAAETNWQVLTNFHMGPWTWPVLVDDPIDPKGAAKVYRLRVDPGPY